MIIVINGYNGYEVTVITCNNFPRGKLFSGYKNNKFVRKEIVDGIIVYRVWSYITFNKGF